MKNQKKYQKKAVQTPPPADNAATGHLASLVENLDIHSGDDGQVDESAVLLVDIQDSPDVWAPGPEWKTIEAPNSQGYPAGNRFNPGTGSLGGLIRLKDKLEYPVKEELRKATGYTVATNHFEVAIDPNAQFWEYHIVGMAENEKRPIKKRIMKTIIDTVPFLRDNQAFFATDHVNTIIAWKDLHSLATTPKIGSEDDTLPGTSDEWRLLDIIDRNVTMQLNLRFIRTIDYRAFEHYTASTLSDPASYDPEPTKNALNIVFTKCFENMGYIINLNAHKFYVVHSGRELYAGNDKEWALCAVRGYYYTIKAGMGKILLNVNPATSAFWNPTTLCNVLLGAMGTFGGDVWALKGLQVYINFARSNDPDAFINAQHSRIKRIRGFGKPVSQQTFQLQTMDDAGKVTVGKTTTVRDYLQQQYKIRLRFPNLAAVNLSATSEPMWFAPEHLDIIPDQIWGKIIPDAIAAAFHGHACVPPDQTRARIEMEGVAQLSRRVTDPQNQLAPLTVCPRILFNPLMLQIPATQLENAQIQYGGSRRKVESRLGKWNLAGSKFLRGAPAKVMWKLLRANGVTQHAENKFVEHFQKQLVVTGVCPLAVHIGNTSVSLPGLTEDHLGAALDDLNKNKDGHGVPQIVVLLLPRQDVQAYSSFKYLADKIFCFHAICATQANFKPQGNDNAMQQYMANIAMKANLKVGGLNHSVDGVARWLNDILVIGADITHPGSGAIENCPSIAAVVGSVEQTAGIFRGKLYLQPESDMVKDLGPAVKELLQAWCTRNKKFPRGILYYRDGVSKGQYDELKRIEVTAIQRAWNDYAASLKHHTAPPLQLTTVIVTKRHNTRFFPTTPKDAMQRNANTFPGTLVDTLVTHPYYTDFYLQSHNAIKGTARPCYYFLLTNGLRIATHDLQLLTHALCHTYVRATTGVSYAPPAYYADRLCERGRCYLRTWYNPSPDTRAHWRALKMRAQKEVQAERAATNARAGGGAAAKHVRGQRKTALEVEQMEGDADKVRGRLVAVLRPAIEARWDAEGKLNRAGPVRRKAIAETMYWM